MRKHFVQRSGFPRPVTTIVRAVDGIDFNVAPGEAFGIVGESGCGKSTAARAMLRLIEPDARHASGSPARMCAPRAGRALTALRRRMQIVFQDPYSSLNPRRTHRRSADRAAARARPRARPRGAAAARRRCSRRSGCRRPRSTAIRTSSRGGQRQRIGIARALAVRAGTDRGGRAGLRARRLGAGAGADAAARSCRSGAAWPSCSSATISAWSAGSARASR